MRDLPTSAFQIRDVLFETESACRIILGVRKSNESAQSATFQTVNDDLLYFNDIKQKEQGRRKGPAKEDFATQNFLQAHKIPL